MNEPNLRTLSKLLIVWKASEKSKQSLPLMISVTILRQFCNKSCGYFSWSDLLFFSWWIRGVQVGIFWGRGAIKWIPVNFLKTNLCTWIIIRNWIFMNTTEEKSVVKKTSKKNMYGRKQENVEKVIFTTNFLLRLFIALFMGTEFSKSFSLEKIIFHHLNKGYFLHINLKKYICVKKLIHWTDTTFYGTCAKPSFFSFI